MSYAIIETGGKQMRVEPGRFYDIELLPVAPEEKVSIDKVLFVNHHDSLYVGQPLVEGAIVEGTVMRHLRGRKVLVYKMRPKKKTRKKRGHRQEITRLMIDSIKLNGTVLFSAETATDVAIAEKTPAAVEKEEPANVIVDVESEDIAQISAPEAEGTVEVTVDVPSEDVEQTPILETEETPTMQ